MLSPAVKQYCSQCVGPPLWHLRQCSSAARKGRPRSISWRMVPDINRVGQKSQICRFKDEKRKPNLNKRWYIDIKCLLGLRNFSYAHIFGSEDIEESEDGQNSHRGAYTCSLLTVLLSYANLKHVQQKPVGPLVRTPASSMRNPRHISNESTSINGAAELQYFSYVGCQSAFTGAASGAYGGISLEACATFAMTGGPSPPYRFFAVGYQLNNGPGIYCEYGDTNPSHGTIVYDGSCNLPCNLGQAGPSENCGGNGYWSVFEKI